MSSNQQAIWRNEAQSLTRDLEALRRNPPPFMSDARMRVQASLHNAINALNDAANWQDAYVAECTLQAPAKVIADYIDEVFGSDLNVGPATGMLEDIKGGALGMLKVLQANGYEIRAVAQ